MVGTTDSVLIRRGVSCSVSLIERFHRNCHCIIVCMGVPLCVYTVNLVYVVFWYVCLLHPLWCLKWLDSERSLIVLGHFLPETMYLGTSHNLTYLPTPSPFPPLPSLHSPPHNLAHHHFTSPSSPHLRQLTTYLPSPPLFPHTFLTSPPPSPSHLLNLTPPSPTPLAPPSPFNAPFHPLSDHAAMGHGSLMEGVISSVTIFSMPTTHASSMTRTSGRCE